MSRFTSRSYDDLAVGPVATVSHTLDADLVARWRALVGYAPGEQVPSSLALTWLLVALREALDGIPAGGVLVRHELRFGEPPTVPSQLRTAVAVAERSERRGRPVVVLDLKSHADDTSVVSNRMHLLWPSDSPASQSPGRDVPTLAAAPAEVLLRATVTQADIDAYADLTGDYNPLHVDAEAGRRSPFGSTIAHGPLPLAFLQRAVEERHGSAWPRGLHLDARYVGPTLPGDVVEVQATTEGGLRLADSTGRLLIRVEVDS